MNITKEVIAHNNELVRIYLKPDDYLPSFNKEIKKAARTIRVPGFRPGHVPEKLIRNRYGKAILTDEINRLVIDALYRYLQENKIEIIGQPLAVPAGNGLNNFDEPGDFEFAFEIGLRPQFEIPLPVADPPVFYTIRITDERIEKEIEALRYQYGQVIHPEAADEECYLHLTLVACDEQGQTTPDGYQTTTWVKASAFSHEQSRKKILSLRKGESMIVNLAESAGSEEKAAAMLNIQKEALQNLSPWFRMDIKEIEKNQPADINQELFDKIFGKDAVTDIESFRQKIAERLNGRYRLESEYKFHHDIKDRLIRDCQVILPDAFLKKWIARNSEHPLSDEDIEKQYPRYAYDLKWALIRNKLIDQFGITVSREELKSYARHHVMQMLAGYGIRQFDNINLDSMAERYLNDEKKLSEAETNLKERKLFELLARQVDKKVQEVTVEEFTEIIRKHRH
jgi:trigger factor